MIFLAKKTENNDISTNNKQNTRNIISNENVGTLIANTQCSIDNNKKQKPNYYPSHMKSQIASLNNGSKPLNMNASFDERMMSQNNSTNNRRSSLDEDKISISSLNSNKRFKNSITDKIKQREMLSEMAAGNGPILSEKDKCQQKMEEKEFTMNHGFNNILSQKIKYKSIVQENISSNQSKYIKNEKPDHNSYYKNYVENPNSSSMLEKIGAKTNINKKKYYNALQEQSNKNQEMKEKEKIVDKNNSLRSVRDKKKN